MNLNRHSLKLVHDTGESPSQRNTVLIIDDQSTGRMILSEIVRSIDKKLDVITFGNPLEAIEYVKAHSVDLVLTDYKMPGLDGIETIRQLRRIFRDEDIPIVCITIVNDREIRYAALEAGATDFLTRPIDRFECRARCKNLITLRRHQLLEKGRSRVLEERIDQALEQAWRGEIEILLRTAKLAEHRAGIQPFHLTRVAKYATVIAREHQLTPHEQDIIELVAPLHDIGNLSISDHILQSNGSLEEPEKKIMQMHTIAGYELLKDRPSKYLQVATRIAHSHHEKFNGEGYPNGLTGKSIPLEARIVAIADVYDALTSLRPYRESYSVEEAFNYIEQQKNRHFDGELVDLFLAQIEEIKAIGKEFADKKN